ncbi:hypothetical protein CSKR_102397 [Clonorchis sinensis]|uniref:Uncharacterized protein n=1 Tax=Clonorchis sinensis TaxID=79923 RepID=A0A419QF50_CLOSI|nr:hypothetical protein CSKR_102397 [Clonorchis sinensis]
MKCPMSLAKQQSKTVEHGNKYKTFSQHNPFTIKAFLLRKKRLAAKPTQNTQQTTTTTPLPPKQMTLNQALQSQDTKRKARRNSQKEHCVGKLPLYLCVFIRGDKLTAKPELLEKNLKSSKLDWQMISPETVPVKFSRKNQIDLQMSVFLENSPIWVQVEHKVDGTSGTAPT